MPGNTAYIHQIEAEDAWNILSFDEGAALIDVRRAAEVRQFGQPDLTDLDCPVWQIEWCSDHLPSIQAHFIVQIEDAVTASTATHLIFYCNDGKRALNAARSVAYAFQRSDRPVDVSYIGAAPNPLQNCWCAANLPWTPPTS